MSLDTAMVLAAGLGTRFREVSGDLPKPLVQVAGKPLIDWALDGLAGAGVQKAVVNIHYKADVLEQHLQARHAPAISLSDEREQLMETGGGLIKASSLLGDDAIFCTNTDAIFDPDAPNPASILASAWNDAEMDALLLLVPVPLTTGYSGSGDFHLSPEGRIEREGAGEAYVFSGLQIIHPRLWAGEECEPKSTNIFWNKALKAGRAFGLVYEGRWMHVGDPEGFSAAEDILRDRT